MSALLQNDLKHIYQLFLIHLTYSCDYLIVIYFVSKIKLGFLMRTGQNHPDQRPPDKTSPNNGKIIQFYYSLCQKHFYKLARTAF